MRFIILIFIFCFLCPFFAHAEDRLTVPRNKSYISSDNVVDIEKHRYAIWRIEEYLSGFKTMRARFMQTVADTVHVSNGTISIARPGKARWEYYNPSRFVIVVNNGRMSYYDRELDQVTYTDVPKTPISILLSDNVNLNDGVKIVNINDREGSVSIVLAPDDSNNRFQTLEMVFSKKPFELRRLQRTDVNNKATTITLSNIEFDKGINESDFSLKNPTERKKKN